MDVSTVSSTTSKQTDTDKQEASAPSDYETFLKLLTEQLKNQDPLDPMDSSDYAVQLATFSNVEQNVKTNDLLEEMNGKLSSSDVSGIASWIGHEAKAAGPVDYNGTDAIVLSPEPEDRADQAVLVTYSSSGYEVDRQPVSLSAEEVVWDGRDENGDSLPAGQYSFRLESYRNGSLIGEASDVASYREVTEVRIRDGETSVVFADGRSVPASEVTGLRQAASGG